MARIEAKTGNMEIALDGSQKASVRKDIRAARSTIKPNMQVHAALETWMKVCLLSWRGACHVSQVTVMLKCPVNYNAPSALPKHALVS